MKRGDIAELGRRNRIFWKASLVDSMCSFQVTVRGIEFLMDTWKENVRSILAQLGHRVYSRESRPRAPDIKTMQILRTSDCHTPGWLGDSISECPVVSVLVPGLSWSLHMRFTKMRSSSASSLMIVAHPMSRFSSNRLNLPWVPSQGTISCWCCW